MATLNNKSHIYDLETDHLGHLMSGENRPAERHLIARARGVYDLLGYALKLRYLCLLGVLGSAALAAFLLTGSVNFHGALNLAGRATVYVELPDATTSLDALAEKLKPVEALVQTLPEELIEHYSTLLGKAWTVGGTSVQSWTFAMSEIYPPGSFVEQKGRRHIISERLQNQLAKLEKTADFAKLRFP